MFGIEFGQSEVSIDVATVDNESNEPEPDVIVLNRPHLEFRSANPGPADLRLVVEIEDSTLRFDLTVKAALYARAAIVEYWVMDMTGRRIIVHRDPREGHYESVVEYHQQESVTPLANANATLVVESMFPA